MSGSGTVWRPFEFTEPGTFVYDVESAGSSGMNGTLTWEIQSVSESGATVRAKLDTDQFNSETTVSGGPEELRQGLSRTPAGALLTGTLFAAPVVRTGGEEFVVGSEWSVSGPEGGSASMQVTGEDSRAGIDCRAWEYRIDGNLAAEGCASTRFQMVLYIEVYDEKSGDTEFRMELTDFIPG